MKLTASKNIYPLTHLIGHRGPCLWVENVGKTIRRFWIIAKGEVAKPTDNQRSGKNKGTIP